MQQAFVKVAVIDDDLSSREAIAGLINAFGFETETFSTAIEFLRFGWPRDLRCLIVDVNMPGMTGFELQTHLAQSGRDVPIIMVSSFPHPEMRKRALTAGAVGFLAKPCDPDALAGHIRQVERA